MTRLALSPTLFNSPDVMQGYLATCPECGHRSLHAPSQVRLDRNRGRLITCPACESTVQLHRAMRTEVSLDAWCPP